MTADRPFNGLDVAGETKPAGVQQVRFSAVEILFEERTIPVSDSSFRDNFGRGRRPHLLRSHGRLK